MLIEQRMSGPSAVVDAEKLVRRCDECQFFTKHIHIPAHEI
jgi:hypothetical protein